jgi:hypothetical protein
MVCDSKKQASTTADGDTKGNSTIFSVNMIPDSWDKSVENAEFIMDALSLGEEFVLRHNRVYRKYVKRSDNHASGIYGFRRITFNDKGEKITEIHYPDYIALSSYMILENNGDVADVFVAEYQDMALLYTMSNFYGKYGSTDISEIAAFIKETFDGQAVEREKAYEKLIKQLRNLHT